jgi:outer membrane protein TolC
MKIPRTYVGYFVVALWAGLGGAEIASAQVSLATAVDLALSHSPKVKMAAADVDKAKASFTEARDAYLPSATAGGGYGDSWGFSANPPTLFTFTSQALVYNAAQRSSMRSASFGIKSAQFALLDAREAVEEEVAQAYLALQHDTQREAALREEYAVAERLVQIVSDRLNAGQDTGMELTRAKLTAAQIHLSSLKAQGDTAQDRTQLAAILGLAQPENLRADQALPALNPPEATSAIAVRQANGPAVDAAYATADSKWALANGDARFRFRPQVEFFAQYNRYATFTKSFATLQAFNPSVHIGANQEAVGVQIQIPLYDRARRDKANIEAAEAVHARAEADDAQRTSASGQSKLRNSLALLQAQAEVAQLDQDLARQQLEVLTLQLNQSSANPNGPQMTPKDEQNARIAERSKYLAFLDADFQLKQAQISLLRQTGGIDVWVKQATSSPTTTPVP